MVIRPGEWKKAKEAIAAGKDINYEGATGSVDFDGNGDVAGMYSVNTVGADGKDAMSGGAGTCSSDADNSLAQALSARRSSRKPWRTGPTEVGLGSDRGSSSST